MLLMFSIMPGTKKLAIPNTSRTFCWNAPEVVSLCSQGCLYVMAKAHPPKEIDEFSDLEVQSNLYVTNLQCKVLH